jgi:hypothetical protein
MGYRYELKKITYQKTVYTNNLGLREFKFSFSIYNRGFAAIFNKRTVYLVLRCTQSKKYTVIALKTDPRFWTPGQTTEINELIQLPISIPVGEYDLFLWLPDSSEILSKRPEYAIRLANENLWESETGLNYLLRKVLIY